MAKFGNLVGSRGKFGRQWVKVAINYVIEAIANVYDAILSNQTKFIIGTIPP